MKKFCEECGASVSSGVQFCENCGARLSEADEPAPVDGPTPLARASGSVSATDRLKARQPASSEGSRYAMEKPGKTGAELEAFAYAGGNLYPSYILATGRMDDDLKVTTALESALMPMTRDVGWGSWA